MKFIVVLISILAIVLLGATLYHEFFTTYTYYIESFKSLTNDNWLRSITWAEISNRLSLDIPAIFLLIIFGSIIVFIAIFREKDLLEYHPRIKSYLFGHILGFLGLFISSVCAIKVSYIAIENKLSDIIEVSSYQMNLLVIIFILSAVFHAFIVLRGRYSWVFATIIHLNPISWCINFIYLKNRWTELKRVDVNKKLNTMLIFLMLLLSLIYFIALEYYHSL